MGAETEFKDRIRPFLEALPNCWWEKTQQRSIRGTPDFLGCVAGRFVALELKSEGGKTDTLQELNLARINASGGIGLIVSPGNWPQTRELLMKLAVRKP